MPKPCCVQCNDICRPGQCGSQCVCTTPCNCTSTSTTPTSDSPDMECDIVPEIQARSCSVCDTENTVEPLKRR